MLKRTPFVRKPCAEGTATPARLVVPAEPERRLVLAAIVQIRTKGGLNAREHHMARARRVKAEREATHWQLKTRAEKPELPAIVLLTRTAPSNGLDDDNLAGALKGVRDQVADWLGVDDKRSDVVRYRYAQERGAWGVRIEFMVPA